MPRPLRTVLCLLHRAQRQTADQRLLRRIPDLLQQLLELLRMDLLLPDADGVSEIIDKCRELPDLFGIRIVMGPVYKRQLLPEKILRHGFIGNQHKIFYYFCRHIPLIRLNPDRPALPVKDDFRFRKIKIDRSPAHPLFPKNLRQLPHLLKHGYQRLILPALILIVIQKDFLYAGIAHPAIHPHDRPGNHMIRDISFPVDRHNAA